MTNKTMGVVLAVMFLSQVAMAASVPARIGSASPNSNSACFTDNWAGMQNNCGYTAWLTIPLPMGNSGSKTVSVTSYAANASNNVGCYVTGVNRELTASWSSPQVWLSQFGASQTITLTGAFVPNSGAAYVACEVKSGGHVNSVDYNW